jgi:ribosomal protein S18 acetylase RimI-like enzyme
MTVLVPMSAESYSDYLQGAVAGYAKDNIDAGRWPEEGALARSLADFRSSLPKGLETPDNYLFEIKAVANGPTVGFIWFAIEETHGMRHAFVYDIEVKPAYRRHGYATGALAAIESRARELGVSSIGLHVFAHNPGAQALYAKFGFDVVSINMRKDIGVKRA